MTVPAHTDMNPAKPKYYLFMVSLNKWQNNTMTEHISCDC